jgi:predicted enzyme related to lactoylglutathione lyase
LAEILTILYVDDVDRSGSFYEAVFGWTRTVDVPNYREYHIGVGLMHRESARSFLGDELCAQMPSHGPKAELYIRGDARALASRLQSVGARCTSLLQERNWGEVAAYFLDPDGYVIAVAEPIA